MYRLTCEVLLGVDTFFSCAGNTGFVEDILDGVAGEEGTDFDPMAVGT